MAPWEPTTDELRDINGDWASSGAQDAGSKYICEWRNGPAALWYEMLGVNEDGTNLDYGFKLKEVRSKLMLRSIIIIRQSFVKLINNIGELGNWCLIGQQGT